jgi:flagellar export protein FliJ
MIDVGRLALAGRHAATLRGLVAALTEDERILGEEIERRRQAVVEADRELRALEKMRDRKLAEHAVKQGRAEARRLDEVAARRAYREPAG